jgi:hypothetical protein
MKISLDKLNDEVQKLEMRFVALTTIVFTIQDEFIKDNPEFLKKSLANMLGNDVIRDGFTQYVNNNQNIPDDYKTFMMEINEIANKYEEE